MKTSVLLAAVITAAAQGQAAAMMTPWGEKVTSENCWREYPRPQMVRANWTCLNGEWDYAVTSVTNTPGRPGKWDGKIRVPYAIESPLSGVGRLLEPDELLWYTRTIDCAPRKGERILLHFDGVDFRAMVFIGHDEVTDVPHEGAQEPFTLDITDFVKPGANELTVCVWDPTENFVGSRGKQCLKPRGCFYTRCSGIWQSVWLETVPETHVADYNVVPDIDVNDIPLRLAADESAHTVKDALERIRMGYRAMALKPIAKTMSMSMKIAQAAYERNIPCFCADLTVSPVLVEWNKSVAARLPAFPGIGDLGLVETNGHMNFRNWETMRKDLAYESAHWTRVEKGVFECDADYYAKSGGILEPMPRYEKMYAKACHD